MFKVPAKVFMPAVMETLSETPSVESTIPPHDSTLDNRLSDLSNDLLQQRNFNLLVATPAPETDLVLDYRASQDYTKVRRLLEDGHLPRNYDRNINRELKQHLKSRGLPHSYNKERLIANLHQSDRDRQFQQPPTIVLTYQHGGFPLQRLPFELRKMIYSELLTIEPGSYSYSNLYSSTLRQRLKIRRGLPLEAFNMVQEFNRLPISITHYHVVIAAGKRILVESFDHRRVHFPNPWLQMPPIFRDCRHVDIELQMSPALKLFAVPLDPRDAATNVKKMIKHLNVLVNVVLRPNKNLQSVRLRLGRDPQDTTGAPVDPGGRIKELEHRCLYALAELRGLCDQGLNKVEFSGFFFVEEGHMRMVKRIITQPRAQVHELRNLSKSFYLLSTQG